MIIPSDKDYKETKQIMLGNKVIKPEFKLLAEWIDSNYGVKTVNIYYDLIDNGKRPRLEICLERTKDKAIFKDQTGYNFDPRMQKIITKKFKELINKQSQIKQDDFLYLFREYFSSKYKYDNLFVYYSDFESIAKIEANESIPEQKVKALKNKLDNEALWEISRGFSSTTFFLYTKAQVKDFENSQTFLKWTDEYFNLLCQYDEFGYFKKEFFSIFLDSKENFDENYQSNWYYYYK